MPLPIITKRLIIRPFTPGDFEAIHAVWSDPEVMRPVPSKAYDRQESWARLSAAFSHQARHGFSKWAVVGKASGTVIGECGVHYLEGGPDIELGYKLARARWGQGLASEAARACLDWALAERPERVVAIVDPGNARSARILGKIGMVREGTFSRFDHTWDFYIAIRRQATAADTDRAASGDMDIRPERDAVGAARAGEAAVARPEWEISGRRVVGNGRAAPSGYSRERPLPQWGPRPCPRRPGVPRSRGCLCSRPRLAKSHLKSQR